MYQGVTNYADYSERVMATNFFMDQHVKLYIDGKEFIPAMAVMDNVYEMTDKRTFTVVFPADLQMYKGSEYLFVYDDPFYEMGKVQFSFTGKNMQKARSLKIDL